MENIAHLQPVSKLNLWTGRVLSGLTSAFLLLDCAMKLAQARVAIEGTARVGYSPGVVLPLGVVELASVLLYLFPRTAPLGAGLLTAYLGGAVATHVRLGEPFWMPIVFGVVIWLGLYLRDPRVRALLAAK
ncbi:MAG TPA: DoxX family protein [Polyangia bacterium]|nr:DoxX family protein [Polyangia bacterium]